MGHYIGIDVACKESAICAIDDKGKVYMKGKVPTKVEEIAKFLNKGKLVVNKIGLETGTECHHLCRGLEALGYDVDIMDARKSAPMMETMKINKNDPNDALALAQILRAKMHFKVCAKSREQLDMAALIQLRASVVDMRTSIANQIRGLCKVDGIKYPGAFKTETWKEELKNNTEISPQFLKFLLVQLNLLEETEKTIQKYDQILEALSKENSMIQLLMTAPGVGRVLATAFFAFIPQEAKFSRSRDVGAFVGLTPREYSSGESSWRGRISKCGPNLLRRLLMHGGMSIIVNSKKETDLRRWGRKIAQAKGYKRASIAVGRKLAVILLRMMQTGKPFQAKAA